MAEEQEYKYVTLRIANFNNEYRGKNGSKGQKGDTLYVPAEIAERWADIGVARNAKESEIKDYKEWREARFKEVERDEDEGPELMGTEAQREAQEEVNLRNRPAPQRPMPSQIGNSPEPKDKEPAK